eukprot:TRINITY_DN27169_c0_g1_i1.p1 TRINITY_DN27169_c0_g1~~TRINITY_DN27169_c0_g1_i1.p1  ORF type:complete len:880 (-),score=149.67 TRINITY_DN27169_c0_g1_i1:63-2702(-)
MDFTLLPISKDSLEWQCSVLKLGGLTVLLNCGLNESLDPKLLTPLIPHLGELDLILLTHADVKHLGALPYILSKYPTNCPIVCTEPVSRLGELSCVSCLEDREKYREASEAYEVDDVLRIFMSRITPLKYRETFRIQNGGRVLAACPYPAGGQLGSSYWTLQVGSISAVYLVDCNMRKGRYLDGLEFNRILPACRGAAQRWDVVITAPIGTMGLPLFQHGTHQGPQEIHAPSKAMTVAKTVREQFFLDETIAALRQGGTVLIPADVAGWIPEILLLCEAAWSQDRQLATSYPLVWLSSMGDMVLDQIKTRLEYMSGEVLKSFETRSQHPFLLKNVRIFQSLEELSASHPLVRPKVIFTTSQHLEGGDSRELFFRLCSEPRSLLWLLGVSPSGTFSRQLLEDFVIGQCLRKEYRLQHHLKQSLPDDELRAFYEAKMEEHELAPPLPPDVSILTKAEDVKKDEQEEVKVKVENGNGAKTDAKVEPSGATISAAEAAKGRPQAEKLRASSSSALWSPLGWPSSRTVAHSEPRNESDDYGHVLGPGELRLWKAQDQEGNKYSGSAAGAPDSEDKAASTVKGSDTPAPASLQGETAKLEDDLDGLEAGTSEWRESLRLHFREPMRCEVRERIVKVACKVRHLPDNSLDIKDLTLLLQLAAPKHIVLLPARGGHTTEDVLKTYFANSSPTDKVGTSPEVHALRAKDAPLQLALRGLKRKVQMSNDLWPQLSFMRTSDGVRVARVRAIPAPLSSDPRVIELGQQEDSESSTSQSALPRTGSVFLSLGKEPLRLSSLKESLLAAEWSRDDVEIEFRAPGAQSGRPWSSRVLTAGVGKAALGWVGRKKGSKSSQASGGCAAPVLRLEGMPSEEFFTARDALYKRCAAI